MTFNNNNNNDVKVYSVWVQQNTWKGTWTFFMGLSGYTAQKSVETVNLNLKKITTHLPFSLTKVQHPQYFWKLKSYTLKWDRLNQWSSKSSFIPQITATIEITWPSITQETNKPANKMYFLVHDSTLINVSIKSRTL